MGPSDMLDLHGSVRYRDYYVQGLVYGITGCDSCDTCDACEGCDGSSCSSTSCSSSSSDELTPGNACDFALNVARALPLQPA